MSASGSGRTRFWIVAAMVGLAVAAALAGYGIWSRNASVAQLQQTADDAAVPRVQSASPKPGPEEDSLTLPGEVVAWNEAQIYGQVSGYVSQWLKDYGAPVEKGEVLATIDTPSLDA
jgi:membrane fusion protein (multidrug efflux system)